MASTITFSNGVNSVEISAPQYGYESEVKLPLHYSHNADKTYTIWDDGEGNSTYDVRTLNVAKFLMNESDISDLNAFFSDSAKGRGEDVNLALGSDATGFFPFCPDRGDKNTFSVRNLLYEQSGQLFKPWKWWEVGMSLVMLTNPDYSLPSQVAEGQLQIGTIEDLRFPKDGYNSVTEYSINNVVVWGGTAYEIDRSTNADRYEVEFILAANQSKMAAVMNYLTVTARGSSFEIVTTADNYLFGHDKGGDGTYTVQLLSPSLVVTHYRFNEFHLPLKLGFVSVA